MLLSLDDRVCRSRLSALRLDNHFPGFVVGQILSHDPLDVFGGKFFVVGETNADFVKLTRVSLRSC